MARPLSPALAPLGEVEPDRPTLSEPSAADPSKTADPDASALEKAAGAGRRAGGEAKKPKRGGAKSIDEALASPDRPITNRVPSDLWELVAARAKELGMPKLRPLLTDALVRALELDPETHREQLRETEKRRAVARIDQGTQ